MPDQVTDSQLHAAQGRVNPFMVGVESAGALEQASVNDMGEDAAIARVKDLQGELLKIHNEAQGEGGELDYSKITSLSGSDEEKGTKIMVLNSRLYGATQALNQKRQEAIHKAQAENARALMGNEGADMYYANVQQMGAFQGPALSELIDKGLQDNFDGLKLGSVEYANKVKNSTEAFGFTIDPKMQNRGGPGRHIMNTLFDTPQWEPNRVYEPGFVPKRTMPIQILPLVHSGPMLSKNMSYWEEVLQDNQAAGRAEGAALPESAYKLELRHYVPISIGHHLPLTEEALEDRDELLDYIDYIMPLGVMQKLDAGIAQGTGAANELKGIMRLGYNKDDPQPIRHKYLAETQPWDVLLQAKKAGMDFGGGILGLQMPTNAVINSDFWVKALTSKSESGGYLVGGPQMALFSMPWGMDMSVATHSMFNETASQDGGAVADYRNFNHAGFVGDMSPMFHKLCYRHGINVRFGLINDDFIKLRVAVRAEVRCWFVVKRAPAFVHLVNPKADGSAPDDRTG